MNKYLHIFIKIINKEDDFNNTKKQIRIFINTIFLLVLSLSIILLIAILYDIKNSKLYVPFALFISITIVTLTLKVSMRDKVIEHHFETIKNVSTNLHILISSANILLSMITYISKLFNGQSETSKHQLINVKKTYENMLNDLYKKESLVFLDQEVVKLLENIITDSIFLQGTMDLTIEKLHVDFVGLVSTKKTNNEIVNICNRLNKDLITFQIIVKKTISKRTDGYNQLVREES